MYSDVLRYICIFYNFHESILISIFTTDKLKASDNTVNDLVKQQQTL